MVEPRGFWQGRRVVVTGHTGFKGSWLVSWLAHWGGQVRGFALAPQTLPSMFEAAGVAQRCEHVVGDIRDLQAVTGAIRDFAPQIVFHLAAQPLVRRSYREPVLTFATNVMGTAHVLEVCRDLPGLEAVVVITTDKVYENPAGAGAHPERDPLGGDDPYSASKAAAEIVAAAYLRSFFQGAAARVATARAGNVIGGGDWSEDRIIPDAVRAAVARRPLIVRNPGSVRPWQHVLEPLAGYLQLAQALAEGRLGTAAAYNFGPASAQAGTVREVATEFARAWGDGAAWAHQPEVSAPHEAPSLLLDSSLAERTLGWRSRLSLGECVDATVRWYRAWVDGADARALAALTIAQIETYLSSE